MDEIKTQQQYMASLDGDRNTPVPEHDIFLAPKIKKLQSMI